MKKIVNDSKTKAEGKAKSASETKAVAGKHTAGHSAAGKEPAKAAKKK